MEASHQSDRNPPTTRRLVCGVVLCAVCWLIGCTSTRNKDITTKSNGLTQFANLLESKKKPREIIDPEAGLDEYDAAMAKFEKKEYDDAAQDFKVIAKKYYDYPVEEDALYMVAECRYCAKRYGWAQDAYDGLIKKYPSTRYLEKSTRRLYAIGAIWLNGDGKEDTKELIQVSSTDVTEPETVKRKPVPNSIPMVPNFFDKSRPLFDTPGNALKALKSVWLHDPLGPLADDAVMLTAVYHIRKGNLREADHYLNVLRTEYPKSEHTKTAFVVGSHVKLASYQGARYDGRDLVDADDLIHSTLNLFPDLKEREALKEELVRISERGAERCWSQAQYYYHRDKPKSEAIYCERVIKEFPKSKYAQLATKRLQELGPQNWSGMLSSYPGEKNLEAGKSSTSGKANTNERRPLKPPVGGKSKGSSPSRRKPVPATKPQDEPEELPPTEPRALPADDLDHPYEELPPGRESVDGPDLVDQSLDGQIERTSSTAPPGRAKP